MKLPRHLESGLTDRPSSVQPRRDSASADPGAPGAEDQPDREAALAGILEQIPHGIVVYDANERLAMVNDAYRRIMVGAPGRIGDTLGQVLRARLEAGEYLEADPEAYVAQALAARHSQTYSRQRRRPNGTVIEIRGARLQDGGLIAVVTDITALTEAQLELTRRADLLASIVHHIPHGISVYGADRRLRLVNDAYRTIMADAPIAVGETIDEIIDRRAHAGEYGQGEPAERARAQRRHDITKPQLRRRRRPNGTVIDVRTAPLPAGNYISIVTDNTKLANAEAELARRAETLDTMLAHIRHGIILWGPDRRIVAANAIVATMLQAPPGLLVAGRTLEETIRSALERGNLGDGATAARRAQWLAEQDRSAPHHDQRLTRDGRVIEVRTDPTPDGGFVTTYTDVTDVREAEEALLLSKAAAEQANAAKTRFLAAMSTELRTPLTAILDQTTQLARASATSDGVGSTAAAIEHAARGLLGLIDSILDMTRLEAGRFDLADDVVDLPQLLRGVLRGLDARAASAEVALVIDLPVDLPAIRADERRLIQAISSVVSNALTHAGAMGSVSIVARHDWAGGGVLLTVRDTGPGIPEQDLERAFEPFTQLSGRGRQGQVGAGLGLFTARVLMRAHGGDLTLRCDPGQGTLATLSLPPDRVMHAAARDTT